MSVVCHRRRLCSMLCGCSPTLTARALLVDMEPKVIDACYSEAQANGLFQYAPRNGIAKQSGSANNWAFGYTSHAPSIERALLNMVRKEVEQCDVFGGFLLTQSVAGGTGSGVGTYLGSALVDDYPSIPVLHHLVLPYTQGEVIVQNYNACLTIAEICSKSGHVVFVENDIMQHICQRLLQLPTPTFPQLNRLIANQLVNVLVPSYESSIDAIVEEEVIKEGKKKGQIRKRPRHEEEAILAESSMPFPLWSSALSHMFPTPAYPISSILTIPHVSSTSQQFSAHTWQYLCKTVRQMQLAHAWMEEGIAWGVKIPTVTIPFTRPGIVPKSSTLSGDASGMSCDAFYMAQFTSKRDTRHPFASSSHDTLLPVPDTYDNEFNTTLSAIVHLRGPGSVSTSCAPFNVPGMYASHAFDPLRVCRSTCSVGGDEKCMTMWR